MFEEPYDQSRDSAVSCTRCAKGIPTWVTAVRARGGRAYCSENCMRLAEQAGIDPKRTLVGRFLSSRR